MNIVLIICIWLILNNRGVLNKVAKVKEILLNIIISNIKIIVIEFKRVLLRFK